MELIEYIKKAIYINLIYEDRYELILSGLKATLILTIVSFVAGTLLGMAFCAGKGSRNRVVRTVCRLFTQLMVKLPPLVLLMIFAYLIFVNSSLTPVAIAVVTFTLKCASHLAEMFRTAVDSVSPGEVEAARTLGYSRRQAFFRVVFPQALHQVMPLYKTQFVLTMQDTSVVSLLAIEDMSRAVTVISSRTMDPVVALVITSIVYLLLGFIANRMLSLADRSKHLYSGEAAQWQ
jgi:polar amino acid transport system permease protein/polar amino acid transport system substrate-binding protein